jgi:integrase
MPRLNGRPPEYSLHKPTGQAKVTMNGKVTYLGKWKSGASLDAYDRLVAALPKPEAPLPKLGDPGPVSPLLVGEVVLLYQAHAERYYARDGVPTGEHVTIRCSLIPLVARFADLPVTEFGPKRLKLVRDDMIKLDWSRRYCNKATAIIKRCFAWAAEEEIIPAEVSNGLIPVKGLKKGRTEAREKATIGPVDDAHVDAILPKVSELVADVLRVMRLTGMRPGECLSMSPAEIDRTDPSCWVYRPGHHKTAHLDKIRAIVLGPKAQAIILPRLMKTGSTGLIFSITRSSLRTSVLRGCDRADVPRFGPNRIRHTVGTEVRAKFGLEAAQVLLGHTRADVTQTYAERDMNKAQEVARWIG